MKAIKKYWPVLIVLLLLALLVKLITDPVTPEATPNNSGKQAVLQEPKSYVDSKTGTVHTETKVAQAKQDQSLHSYYQKMIADLKSQLRLKEKQIETITTASIRSEGTAILKRDSVPMAPNISDSSASHIATDMEPAIFKSYWTYADKWMYMRGELVGDSLSIDYRTEDSIALVTYWKKRGWFGPRELYINGFTMNPKSKVYGLQSVKVSPGVKPPKWGIGLNVGYGITATGLSPYIGVGLSRNFIRF